MTIFILQPYNEGNIESMPFVFHIKKYIRIDKKMFFHLLYCIVFALDSIIEVNSKIVYNTYNVEISRSTMHQPYGNFCFANYLEALWY